MCRAPDVHSTVIPAYVAFAAEVAPPAPRRPRSALSAGDGLGTMATGFIVRWVPHLSPLGCNNAQVEEDIEKDPYFFYRYDG